MLRGLKEFQKNLKELEEKARGKVLSEALLRAVQPTVQKAASNAPRGTGKLAGSMTAQSMKYAKPDEAIVRVGPGRPQGSHGILLEYGTIYMTKRPFLASAFEATFQEVAARMGDEIGDAFRR